MSYEQIKQEFLNYEERLNQINLLYIELLSNLTIAENLEEDTSKETTPDDIGFRTPMWRGENHRRQKRRWLACALYLTPVPANSCLVLKMSLLANTGSFGIAGTTKLSGNRVVHA